MKSFFLTSFFFDIIFFLTTGFSQDDPITFMAFLKGIKSGIKDRCLYFCDTYSLTPADVKEITSTATNVAETYRTTFMDWLEHLSKQIPPDSKYVIFSLLIFLAFFFDMINQNNKIQDSVFERT